MEPGDKKEGYEKYKKIWCRVEDFCEGEDAVKDRKEEYLPMLPSQAASITHGINGRFRTLYDLFLEKATVWPGASKTLKAYTGILTRKTPQLESPEDLVATFSLRGEDIFTSAIWAAKELMKSGVGGFLVDYPEGGNRAYAVKYGAKDILDWDYEIADGKMTLGYVSLVDKWREGEPCKLTVLTIVNERYTAIEYEAQEVDSKMQWVKIGEVQPMINGKYFGYIPFVPFSEDGIILEYNYPLMTDVVNLNKAHYQNDAEYRNALTFAGRPTPCVAGLRHVEGDGDIQLGTTTVLQFDTDGQWGMLGLDDASGINAIRQAGEDLKTDMAVAGSRALQSDPKGIEAVDTAKIHREGEHGQLSNVAKVVSDAMTKTLMIMAEWSGENGEWSFRFNTDFNPAKIDTQTLNTLWQMYVSGDISWDLLYYNMQKGELTPDVRTADQERAAAAEDLSARMPQGTIPLDGENGNV